MSRGSVRRAGPHQEPPFAVRSAPVEKVRKGRIPTHVDSAAAPFLHRSHVIARGIRTPANHVFPDVRVPGVRQECQVLDSRLGADRDQRPGDPVVVDHQHGLRGNIPTRAELAEAVRAAAQFLHSVDLGMVARVRSADVEQPPFDVLLDQFAGGPFRPIRRIVQPPPEALDGEAEPRCVRPVRRLVGQLVRPIDEVLHISRCLYGESCSPISTCALQDVERPVPRPAPCQRLLGQRLRPADEHPARRRRMLGFLQQHGNGAGPRGQHAERLFNQQPFARPDLQPARLDRLLALDAQVDFLLGRFALGDQRRRRHLPTFHRRARRVRAAGRGGGTRGQQARRRNTDSAPAFHHDPRF